MKTILFFIGMFLLIGGGGSLEHGSISVPIAIIVMAIGFCCLILAAYMKGGNSNE